MRPYWALFIFITLVGCSSGGGSDSNETGAAGVAIESRFVGLWDRTKVVDDAYGEDIYYYYLGADGVTFDYDYYGDSFNNMGNCYAKADNHETYQREGSNYRVTHRPNDNPSISILFRLDIVDNELQATALEALDSPIVYEGHVFKLGKKLTGISVTDIENQLCSEY